MRYSFTSIKVQGYKDAALTLVKSDNNTKVYSATIEGFNGGFDQIEVLIDGDFHNVVLNNDDFISPNFFTLIK